MKFKVLIVSVFFICSLISGISLAQNKVVVIPLMEDASLEPYAQVADTHPPNSSYSLGINYIIDKATGLVWQQMDNNTTYDWDGAMNYCHNDPILDGKTDWRLPSVGELMSIVHYGNINPAINSIVFPGTNSQNYWTASNYVADGTRAWYVSFSYGWVWDTSKSDSNIVRCVRKLTDYSKFKDNGNGTVTDVATGLTWQRQDDNNLKTWSEAGTYCQELGLAGGGWHVPTIKELRSIVDDRVYNPAIDPDAFPGTNVLAYWSSTTIAGSSDRAWTVYFDDGNVTGNSKSFTTYVRCVR